MLNAVIAVATHPVTKQVAIVAANAAVAVVAKKLAEKAEAYKA